MSSPEFVKTVDGRWKRVEDCTTDELEWSNYKRDGGALVIPVLVGAFLFGIGIFVAIYG